MTMVTAGEKIRIIRKESGIQQKDLAAAAKMPVRTLQRYELGEYAPKTDYLINICRVLGVNILAFTDWNELITDHAATLRALPIAEKIKTLRYAAGMDFKKLEAVSKAKTKTAITAAEVKKIEEGKKRPSEAFLNIFATTLDIPNDILTDVPTPEPQTAELGLKGLDDIYMEQLINLSKLLNNDGIKELSHAAEILLKIDSYRK